MRTVSSFLTAVVVAVSLAAGPAAAANGTREVGSATYEVRPDGSVTATIEVSVTNTTTDRVEGNSILRRYVTGIPVPVAAEAANAVATSGGTRLGVTIERRNEFVSVAVVSFPNLFAGQTRTFTLRYDIVGAAPRSVSFERANAAYALFVAFAVGDPGSSTVTVTVPGTNTSEVVGSPFRRTTADGIATFTAMAIDDPDSFAPLVSSRDDAALTTLDADVGDRDIVVHAWPGDTAWQDFARDGVTTGVVALEALIGRPWPVKGQLQIVEAATPYLRGYAGWFAPSTRTIEVGEDLDRETLYHELSHVWFNNDLFDERWMAEAYAEEYAWRALVAAGETPSPPAATESTAPGARPLALWKAPVGSSTSDAAREAETYGYATSAWLLHELFGEIGADRMAKVIDAAADDVSAYDGRAGARGTLDVTSERLLDLLESVGGSARAADLFTTKVFAAGDSRLAARAEARQHYADLRAVAGAWTLPRAVRDAMDDWRFADAERAMATARQILDLRAETDAALGSAGVTRTAKVSEAFGVADGADLDALVPMAIAERDSAVVLAAARSRHDEGRSIPARVGLLGAHPERDLERAKAAMAADDPDGVRIAAAALDAHLADAAAAGWWRIASSAGALLVLAAALVLVLRFRRRRLRRRSAGGGSPGEAGGPSPWPVIDAAIADDGERDESADRHQGEATHGARSPQPV